MSTRPSFRQRLGAVIAGNAEQEATVNQRLEEIDKQIEDIKGVLTAVVNKVYDDTDPTSLTFGSLLRH